VTLPSTIPGFDSTRDRRAIVVRGGWDGHQPVEATDLMIPHLQENGFAVEVFDSPAPYADADLMAATDLVVQSMTMSTIEPEALRGLIAAVEAGTGFAGWHGGIADSYRNSSDYLHLVGGQFATHPGKAPEERVGGMEDNYVPYTVNITDLGREHPITAGIEDFDLVTEQYWVLADSYIDVLATTTQKVRAWDPWHREVTSPAVWTRQWGQGRIFVCTPGHRVDILEDPNVGTLVRRGLLWASR
jgi:type 1 glutamine amidotransferase